MIQEQVYKCAFCGSVVKQPPSQLKKTKLHFCNRDCYNKYRTKKLVCKYCGKTFRSPRHRAKRFRNHFCCHECFLKWNKGENNTRCNQIEVTCVICGKKFKVKPYRVEKGGAKTCSKECRIKYSSSFLKEHPIKAWLGVTGENHPQWQGGISFEPYCPKFNNEFKERVRAFFNYRCVECGKTQEEEGRALCIHHVNYNKKTCCDNTIPLFVPLCDTCHKRTNRHRDYWQLHFTELIYLQHGGKCYYSQEEFAQLTCTSEQAVAQEA